MRPEAVVEVRYDKVQSRYFSARNRDSSFRDDKDAAQCTWHELRPPVRATDSVASLLQVVTQGQTS